MIINKQIPISFQIKLWFSGEGEKQLTPLESLTLSVAKIKEMRESLDQFLEESVVKSATQFLSTFPVDHLLCIFRRQAKLITFVIILTAPAEAWPAASERVTGVPSRFCSP